MDQHQGMMGGAAAPSPFSGGMWRRRRRGMMMHMTFFWGEQTEVLFDGWPGRRGAAMYAAALSAVFVLAALVEWLSGSRYMKPGAHRAVRTLVHTLRVGLANLVMLAVMSFNGGVFLAAVAGHAVGFLVFGSRVFGKPGGDSDGLKSSDHKETDLPPLVCC